MAGVPSGEGVRVGEIDSILASQVAVELAAEVAQALAESLLVGGGYLSAVQRLLPAELVEGRAG